MDAIIAPLFSDKSSKCSKRVDLTSENLGIVKIFPNFINSFIWEISHGFPIIPRASIIPSKFELFIF